MFYALKKSFRSSKRPRERELRDLTASLTETYNDTHFVSAFIKVACRNNNDGDSSHVTVKRSHSPSSISDGQKYLAQSSPPISRRLIIALSPFLSPLNSGHEVLAAAAAAAAEAEEVGEQRRGINGRDVAVRRAGATQDLVDVVVDAGRRLPFAVHRDVRLDAGVPAGVDAAPGRLLRSPVRERGGLRGRNRERGRREKMRERGIEESVYLKQSQIIIINIVQNIYAVRRA